MSRHFSLQDPYDTINVYEASPVYPIYAILTYFGLDASMAIALFIEIDSSKATPLHFICLDSAVSSTMESRVEGRGGGGWGYNIPYKLLLFAVLPQNF